MPFGTLNGLSWGNFNILCDQTLTFISFIAPIDFYNEKTVEVLFINMLVCL